MRERSDRQAATGARSTPPAHARGTVNVVNFLSAEIQRSRSEIPSARALRSELGELRSRFATFPVPQSRPIALRKRGLPNRGEAMTDRDDTQAKIRDLIDPFNKKGVEISGSTRFAQDLEWDSLTVMDFVASVEDEFDILISMNRAAEIETVDQLVDAVRQLESER